MNKDYVMAGLLIASCMAIGFGVGYHVGQLRPPVMRSQIENVITAAGWDNGNKCVAVWLRDTNTGAVQWIRLDERVK